MISNKLWELKKTLASVSLGTYTRGWESKKIQSEYLTLSRKTKTVQHTAEIFQPTPVIVYYKAKTRSVREKNLELKLGL